MIRAAARPPAARPANASSASMSGALHRDACAPRRGTTCTRRSALRACVRAGDAIVATWAGAAGAGRNLAGTVIMRCGVACATEAARPLRDGSTSSGSTSPGLNCGSTATPVTIVAGSTVVAAGSGGALADATATGGSTCAGVATGAAGGATVTGGAVPAGGATGAGAATGAGGAGTAGGATGTGADAGGAPGAGAWTGAGATRAGRNPSGSR